MASNDLILYSDGEYQFGSNVARTKRIIAKLLLDWTTSKDIGPDGKRSKDRPAYLTAIYFDKLVEFYSRIWDQLKYANKVRYSSAFTSQRGFHGPGRALHINRDEEDEVSLGTDPDDHRNSRWAFSTEIVEKLKPALGNARLLFSLTGAPPWKAMCRVLPEIDPSQWESWLMDTYNISDGDKKREPIFLTAIEVEYVKEISKMISCLSRHELRALGTHYLARETCADINFNLNSWDKRFDHLEQFFRGVEIPIQRVSYELVSTTREVRQKSSENRKAYETGWKKCLEVCPSEDVKAAFLTVQRPASEIWDDPTLNKYKAIADPILSFSIYIRRGLNEIEMIPRLKDKERQESEEIIAKLKHALPSISLSLRDYKSIRSTDTGKWLSELIEYKKVLFQIIPPLLDYSQWGIM